ncbi:MAG: putative Ig domain-containing protein [Rhodocyclaceae bacterium]
MSGLFEVSIQWQRSIRMAVSYCLWTVVLTALLLPVHVLAGVSVERLSLFASAGGVSAEDRRLPQPTGSLAPLGLASEFEVESAPSGEVVWRWTLTNQTASPIVGLRLTAFVDLDIEAETTTYFNESSELIALGAPADHIAPDRWEVSEPGYYAGDLLGRAVTGALANVSAWSAANPDDAAVAASLPVAELAPGQTVVVFARMAQPSATFGVLQANSGAAAIGAFQFFALLEAASEPCVGAGCPPPVNCQGGVCPPCVGGQCLPDDDDDDAGKIKPIPAMPLTTVLMLIAMFVLLGVRRLPAHRLRCSVITAIALMALSVADGTAWALFENGHFESRSYDAWAKIVGQNGGLHGRAPFSATSVQINQGGDPSRFHLMEGGLDPRAPHLLLPRQGNVTAKINNEQTGGRVNGIQQRAVISEYDRDPVDGKLHVRFSYAAVLEDPNHPPNQQPYFFVQLTDVTTGTVLYHDFAYANQPGRLFFSTRDNLSRTWLSTPFIDVDMEVPDASLGHEIEVRVLVAGCEPTGHAGYVYVDAFGSLAIPIQGSCINDLAARAKPGNVQLTWADSGAAAYGIYRSDSLEGPYVRQATTESRRATWLDRNVAVGGRYYYSVRALDEDGREMCASGEVVAVVPEHWAPGDPLNRPPRFLTRPVPQADVRNQYVYEPGVVDPDGDTLTFALNYGPIGMTLAGNGRIEWQPEATGTYRVNLEVTDGQGHTVNQAFAIEVGDDNLAPVIANTLPEKVPAGVPVFTHQVVASDPEGDALIYSMGSQASNLTMSVDGFMRWSNPKPGRYPITIVVADARGASTRQQSVVVVEGIPEFVSRPLLSATVGEPYRYQAKAVDHDGDPVRYELLQAPQGMTIDEHDGTVAWLPGAAGSPAVRIAARDPDGNTSEQSFTVRVTTNPNRAPVITSVPPQSSQLRH